MKALLIVALGLTLSACTVSRGVVKDVSHDEHGNLVLAKCDIKAYLAFYGLIAAEENCVTETKSSVPGTQAKR